MKNKYRGLIEKLYSHVSRFEICDCRSNVILYDIYGNPIIEDNPWEHGCKLYDVLTLLPQHLEYHHKNNDLGGCLYKYNPDYVILYDSFEHEEEEIERSTSTKIVAKLIEKLPLDYYNPIVHVPEDLIRICYNYNPDYIAPRISNNRIKVKKQLNQRVLE